MTWDELEKRLKFYLYQNFDGTIWGRFEKRNKRLSLDNIIYLCKKCYEANL